MSDSDKPEESAEERARRRWNVSSTTAVGRHTGQVDAEPVHDLTDFDIFGNPPQFPSHWSIDNALVSQPTQGGAPPASNEWQVTFSEIKSPMPLGLEDGNSPMQGALETDYLNIAIRTETKSYFRNTREILKRVFEPVVATATRVLGRNNPRHGHE